MITFLFCLIIQCCSYPINLEYPVYKIVVRSPSMSTFIRPVRSTTNVENSAKQYQKLNEYDGDDDDNNDALVSVVANGNKTRNSSSSSSSNDGKIVKNPHFIGNQHAIKLRIADGAYPVYYAIARVNGKFGESIKVLDTNQKFNKINNNI